QGVGDALHRVPPLFERRDKRLCLLDIPTDVLAICVSGADLTDVFACPEILAIHLQVIALPLDHFSLERIAALTNDDIWAYVCSHFGYLTKVRIKAVCWIWIEVITNEL